MNQQLLTLCLQAMQTTTSITMSQQLMMLQVCLSRRIVITETFASIAMMILLFT